MSRPDNDRQKGAIRPVRPVRPIRIVACGVFRPSLEQFKLDERFPDLNITYLPSSLHINPEVLRGHLLEEVTASRKRDERVTCLYGECFKDIGLFCNEHGVVKIHGHHCYEILLGTEIFRQITDENAKTYFLERELVLNFEEYCIRPLELYDEEMKALFFKNYERLVYVRQPSDPDLMPRVERIADFLGLSIISRDADYSNLKKVLVNLIDPEHLYFAH
jgi:hypothetical protein